MSTETNRVYLSDYQAPEFEVQNIKLHFDLHETQTKVTTIQNIKKLKDVPLVLAGHGLKLISIKVNNSPLSANEYKAIENELTIPSVPVQFTLETVVEINPQENKSCTGLYLSDGCFTTQCEPEGFRHITYFIDRPDIMTSYEVTLDADKSRYPKLLSNGDCIEKTDLANNRHSAKWIDPFKKPSYLFALVAGDLGVIEDTFVTKSNKKVKLEVYAPHGKQDRCWHALESLKKAMKWDEEKYGLEYDLNQYMIVSMDDFNMGAMENKGLNIFNSKLVLADVESATDTDFERIESVVGHEYFHNWTGNRVTCRNWFELSLKEGLTVFRDQEFSADLNSRSVQRIKDVDSLRSRQFTEDAGQNAHPVRPESCLSVDNFYTATIYEKGAEVIRMMQTIVGEKGFRSGMDEYFKRHDGQAVTIIDFANAIAAPNNADFSQFKLWYSQSGTPTVTVTEDYNSSTKTYTLTLEQDCALTEKEPKKENFHIPMLIGLISKDGKNLKLNSSDISYNSDEKPVLHLKLKKQSYVFTDLTEKPVLSLNREFSAPIKLIWAASDTDLVHLVTYDTDSFNRREAMFKLLSNEVLKLTKDLNTLVNPALLDAMKKVISDKKIEPQFKSLILQFPDTELVALDLETFDALAVAKAKEKIVKSFVDSNKSLLLGLYEEHHQQNNAANRTIKNTILNFLTKTKCDEALQLANKQFNESKNMTDKLVALHSLCHYTSALTTQALEKFYAKWSNDLVVFTKWLQVQAVIENPNTLEVVKKLSQDKAFKPDNPNNIYALHNVYAHNHYAIQSQFDESLNWLLAEIERLDKNNPQLAARICSGFSFVKKYSSDKKELATKSFAALLAKKTLSKNSTEILESYI